MQHTNFAETNDERQDLLDSLKAGLDRRGYNKCKGVDDGVDETGGPQEKISCLDVDVRCARALTEDRVVCNEAVNRSGLINVRGDEGAKSS